MVSFTDDLSEIASIFATAIRPQIPPNSQAQGSVPYQPLRYGPGMVALHPCDEVPMNQVKPGMMSPRKSMGHGSTPSGASDVKPFPAGTAHPDAGMGTQREMGDSSRGIGSPVNHTAGQMPSQAAPDHGPHHERQLGYNRGGKA